MKLFKFALFVMLCIFGLTACGSQNQNSVSGEGETSAAEEITAATFVTEDIGSETVNESEGVTVSEASTMSSISFDVSAPEISFKVKPFFNIGIKDKSLSVLGNKVGELEKAGLTADQDLSATVLKSQEIKKNIAFHYQDAVLTIAAVNPYENEAPLADCTIVSASSEDTTGVFTMDSSDHLCGKATYDDLTFDDIYEKTDNKLVYKTFVIMPMTLSINIGQEDPKGEKILEAHGDTDLILDFQDGLLHRFTFLLPELYYGGMQDNIITLETVDSIDDTAIEAAKIVRDDILADLKTAFSGMGIDVDINDKTGEIVMGNDVLFDIDSYDLSDAGKDYIDRFMGAYASVVFGDKYSDSIAEVCFEGHTDSSGEEEHNQTLSEKRAEAIMNYCLESEKNGMTSDQKEQLKKVAKSVGYASSDLVYDEKGNEDPEKSRRAAIKFFVNVE